MVFTFPEIICACKLIKINEIFQFHKPENPKPKPEKYSYPETRTRINPKITVQTKPDKPEPECLSQRSTRTRRILNPIHH